MKTLLEQALEAQEMILRAKNYYGPDYRNYMNAATMKVAESSAAIRLELGKLKGKP